MPDRNRKPGEPLPMWIERVCAMDEQPADLVIEYLASGSTCWAGVAEYATANFQIK